MTVDSKVSSSVSLRDSDALYMEDYQTIQQNTFDLMTRCSEIDRMILQGASNVKELVDLSVRKAMDTQKLLERYELFHSQNTTSRKDTKYTRLAENFARASKKLEDSIGKYSESAKEDVPVGTRQLRDMAPKSFGKQQTSSTSSGYEYISSMEEGGKHQTLADLTRIGKDMNSLQDMYYSLSEVATQQSSIMDSVQSRLVQASVSAKSAVTELGKATDRMDYWTRIKVYTVTGVTAIGVFFWLI